MKKIDTALERAADLRRMAEKKIRQEEKTDTYISLSDEDIQKTVHELRVHQIELEMQNEDLRSINMELNAVRERYSDLYNMAPVGYCTLSENGLILEANFTTAAMLGVPRGKLIRQPVTRFINREDQDIFYMHRKRLINTGKTQGFELRMLCNDGTDIRVYMVASAEQEIQVIREVTAQPVTELENDDKPMFRIVMNDITESRMTEKIIKIQHDLLIDLNSCSNINQGLDKVLKSVLQLECVDCGAVYISDPADGSLNMAVHHGLSDEFAGHVSHFAADSQTVKIVKEGKLLYGSYADILPMRDPVRKKEGIRALIVFPIMSQGQLIAVINLASHRYDSIPEDTRKSLEIIAFQVGSTLLRLRKDTLLRENEEIFNQFMTNSPIYIFFKDENIRPLKLSSNYEKMLGKPVKELLGKTMDELFPSELAKTMVADDLRILKEGKQISVEEVFNGRHYSTVKFPIQIEGEPRFLSGYTIDITERKQAEEKLRESEGKYRTIVETTMEWIWEIDVNGRHIFSNPKISDILGYSIEEIMGNSADEFIHPDDRKEVETKMSLYIAEKQGWRSWVLRWKHKDGSYRYLESNACPIFNNTGDLIGYQGADRDITDRILAEEKRIEIERHLFHVQKLESLGLLAGGIAHDFNNLLAVILGNLELAMDDIPPDSIVRPFLEGAFNASKKSASLTRQMLAYSGKGRFIIENINISELVQENFNIFRSSIPGTITMNLHMNADIPFINADASQIQQVVMNLITNAAESIGEKAGDITISTDVLACDERFLSLSRIEQKPEPGNFIFLEVSDTGCGMDDNTLKKLFDPFFTTKFTGRGLGMAALQGIIRSHKGAIMVESSLNHGTTVRIYFPVAPGENSDSMNTVSAHQTRSSSIEPSLSAGVILIVDDDLAILKLCSSIVRRFGFSVMTAVDGREAVEIYGNNADQITCVILDLTMPKMDGVATFKAMKDIRHDVKVILSSGYSEQAATEHFKGTGLTGFIQKPYGKQELMDKLNLVLKK